MPTREVYQINQTTGKSRYSGYVRFGNDGSFQGTAGGYAGNRNNRNNGASRVQNIINMAAANGARRNPASRRR